MAKPFLSHVVWVNTQPSLTSRVWAGWPSVLPLRPSVSFFACGDVGANCFRRTLHRLGCHLQTSQNLHLLASVIEGSLQAHYGLHAAYARRAVAVFYVELAVNGE